MITSNLRMNQLTESAFAWYQTYLDTIDSRDIETYADFLADDISVQFNNDDPVSGKDSVVAMLGQYWQSFAGLQHDLTNIYGTDQNFVLEALNHYERHDGKNVTTRAVAFTDLNENGEVSSVRVYADATPIFAP